MSDERDQTDEGAAKVRDRITLQLCPVIWSPSLRIFRTSKGKHVFYSLEEVHLHATKPVVVRGRLLVDCGTFEECKAAIPRGLRPLADLKPSSGTKGIVGCWF